MYAPRKPKALRRSHIWVCPAPMPYKGITSPPPELTSQKKLKSIYGHDDPSSRTMTQGKTNSAPPTKERPNMVPLDAI